MLTDERSTVQPTCQTFVRLKIRKIFWTKDIKKRLTKEFLSLLNDYFLKNKHRK